MKRDRTVASVMHHDNELIVLDRQESWQGTSKNPVRLETVETWLYEATRQYNRAQIVFDPWQPVHLAQRLREKRLRLTEFTFSASSVGRLALALHRLLRDHQLAIYEDSELIEELANIRLVESSPGAYRIDHDPDKHDDRAISLALAAHHLISKTKRRRTGSMDLTSGLSKGSNSSAYHFAD